MGTRNTPANQSAREEKMRNPKNGLGGLPGKKPAIVVAIGAAPTFKKPATNNRNAGKIRK